MDTIDDLDLLRLFHRCCHLLHTNGKCHGQERLLIQLLENGSMTQRELIDLTKRRSATLSEQLDNMDKAGYIIRSRNEQDRRNVDISLTPSGLEAAKSARDNRIRRARRLFLELSQEEKRMLSCLMQKLLASWENLDTESEEDLT